MGKWRGKKKSSLMRFGNTEQGQGVDKGVEALIDGPGYRKRRTICIFVCLDIQKRDWGRWEVEAEGWEASPTKTKITRFGCATPEHNWRES